MKNENHIQIQGWMVNELKLKGNTLMVYAIIYGFSQDGNSKYTGTTRYIREWLSCSRQTVYTCFNELVDAGLIERHPKTVNGVELVDYSVILNFDTPSKNLIGVHQNLDTDNTKDNTNILTNIKIKNKSFKEWILDDFKNEMAILKPKFMQDLEALKAFYDYWREPSPSGKMRLQMQPTWDTELRIKNWIRRNKDRSPSQDPVVNKFSERL